MFLIGTVSDFQKHTRKTTSIEIDEILFTRIAEDDKDAFEMLYRLTDKAVYGFILSILKNPHDAEDTMQDTYLRIRAAAHLYKPQGKPLAWIFTIARNLSLMKIRSGKRDSFSNYEDLENQVEFASAMNEEDRIVLEAAFRILEWEERQIVILHAITGLKHREIAEILHFPLSTVLSKYKRSLNKLRKHLEGKE